VDTTVKVLYGHQDVLLLVITQKKPGRPSHTYHTFSMANFCLIYGICCHKYREAMRSRPLLLHAIGKQVNHSGQTFIKITSTHGRLSKVKKMLNRIVVFFKQLKDAEQLTDIQRW
jgi:hypothetical protein